MSNPIERDIAIPLKDKRLEISIREEHDLADVLWHMIFQEFIMLYVN
ncbi:hypothetical protein HNR44_002572 [Geomicrobium halophilum]|uniref:Uncharacterized protein n=1 Tax=Geomicrobium halophilum TaxID=549000 RepID=A0A841PPB8_9BACL|nr:hypothetical protein [Geomicrobium halophilum]MBB6450589.1 hypothetical protein [Geomicrobium halophilum]